MRKESLLEHSFPYLTEARIWMSGDLREGGAGFVSDGSRARPLNLPTLLFGLFVALCRKAQSDAAAALDEWIPRGFLATRQMHREMVSLGLEADQDYVLKYVHRLREEIDLSLGEGWGMKLIEYRKPFGYRISTPPENVSLRLLSSGDGSPT